MEMASSRRRDRCLAEDSQQTLCRGEFLGFGSVADLGAMKRPELDEAIGLVAFDELSQKRNELLWTPANIQLQRERFGARIVQVPTHEEGIRAHHLVSH